MVQLGGRMNNSHTTKDAIILKIREIVARDGLNALSIRGLANELDVYKRQLLVRSQTLYIGY